MSDIAIVMGSDSDWEVMKAAKEICSKFDVACTCQVVSAHRTPEEMIEFGKNAKANGHKVIIAGAGGAAHLPGMLASTTTVPVIGVPIKLKSLDGMDSLLSIVQMPKGVPVATVAIDNSTNAALLALRILAVEDAMLAAALADYRVEMAVESQAKTSNLK
jgi:5-(carboxyamino)imidazole ribonucleotide mutase